MVSKVVYRTDSAWVCKVAARLFVPPRPLSPALPAVYSKLALLKSLASVLIHLKMPLTIKPPEGTPGKAWPAIAVGLFVAFGGVLFGYDTGTIGGILAMPYWLQEFSTGATDATTGDPTITAAQKSEIVSLLSAGTFFGALTAAPTADYFGRKWGLQITVMVFTFGVVLQTAATAIPLFVAGRFFAGYGVGMISAMIPLYQSETAPKWIRGTIVGAYQLAITVGILLAAVVDNSSKDRNDSGSYRIPIAVQFAFALILFGGMLVLPESPRMWIKRGKPEEAAKSLSKLRRLDVDHPALIEELSEIAANHEYELSLGKATYIDCCRGNLGKRLLTGCLLQVCLDIPPFPGQSPAPPSHDTTTKHLSFSDLFLVFETSADSYSSMNSHFSSSQALTLSS